MLLSEECEFTTLTADTHCQDAICDAFITGLASPDIRQRLLEKEVLSLSEAIQLARSLNTTQRNVEVYSLPDAPRNLTGAPAETTRACLSTTGISAAASTSSTCFFCGRNRHPSPRCPAQDAVCLKACPDELA